MMDAIKTGKTIAYLRKKLGYTQKDLALRIGISDKAVSKWERGVGMPDIAYLRKLAILLNTDTESLLAGSAIQENSWQGILVVDDNEISLSTIVYDKPLAHYLLGYFMLLGISNIVIMCSDLEKNKLEQLYGDGSKLGVELKYSTLTLFETIKSGIITAQNVMLVYDRVLLYGVDQTRFFQRAMNHKEAFSLLAFPKHGNRLTHLVYVDEDLKIVKEGLETDLRHQYDYNYIPFLFCPSALLQLICPTDTPESFVDKLIETEEGFAEILDRGFVEIQINDWIGVNEASTFVRIVQDKCGMEIYCLEEIAWRRGMISMSQFKSIVDEGNSTRYCDYLQSLYDRFCEEVN